MSENKPGGAFRNTIYRQVTASGRRMGPMRRWLYRLAAPTLLALVRLWWRSCRIVAVVGEEHLDAVLARWPSFLPCYWHQHQLFCARYLLLQQPRRPLRLGFLISPSVDGELGAMIVRRAGGYVIRGSSSHTGAQALKAYFEALMREQVSPIITPDGPRGPRFKFKPGAILLAQMSGRPMLPLAYAASRAALVHWDRFVLPLPFARIAIAIGSPREVPRALDTAALGALQLEMQQSLQATFAAARAALTGAR
ncbi:MAG TPA: lysophospholipid acyltransferase family protein [Steroidobacteraceae bacterium]|nr:lysophospholipid acyltransferase family protein [Steroidobacteraceae bacterium]